ncbi:acetolactate synthase 2 small subunit [Psychromonas aquatilis]|uniref:Acetolactate synthase 2 small subunit n=1 Tax=Psychromonas aquatilis TaxID=2005072 RepID=A0ABU9GL69_9GAMM
MNNSIVIKASNSPEFLERVLRVCRHRGFSVDSMSSQTEQPQQTLSITLNIVSERDISLLTKQIEKIIGVIEITLSKPQEIKATA